MVRRKKIKRRRVFLSGNYFLNSLVAVIVLCFLFLFTVVTVTPQTSRNPQYFGGSPDFNNVAPRSLNIPILLYHYVEYVKDTRDTIRKSLDINPYVFEHQVETLRDAGYTFLTPHDINEIFEGRKHLPRKPVILSFDDGYQDFYTDVLPVLKKYNARAVSYVVSGFLNEPNYMTSAELKEVIKSGLVEIGCHTAHHLDLKHAAPFVAEAEIKQCESDIQKDFGIVPVSFAYPYGVFNQTLPTILARHGLKNAVTTQFGSEISLHNIYTISRIRPGGRMGTELTSYLEKTIVKETHLLNLE